MVHTSTKKKTYLTHDTIFYALWKMKKTKISTSLSLFYRSQNIRKKCFSSTYCVFFIVLKVCRTRMMSSVQ